MSHSRHVGIVVLVISLVVGPTTGSAARDEGPAPTSWASFAWRPAGLWDGMHGSGIDPEADDPRASGRMWIASEMLEKRVGEDWIGIGSDAVRLVNDGGAWSGAGREFEVSVYGDDEWAKHVTTYAGQSCFCDHRPTHGVRSGLPVDALNQSSISSLFRVVGLPCRLRWLG